MAGRGFAPRNGDVDIEVEADGKVRGPDLPESYDWPAQTRAWWDNWRRSAQAVRMTDTDWDFMLDTAMLHGELWSGNGAVAPELRLRVAKFGATLEDRARLKMAIVVPEGPSKKKPAAKGKAKLRVVDSQAS
jgi:hypothetical protein